MYGVLPLDHGYGDPLGVIQVNKSVIHKKTIIKNHKEKIYFTL